MVQKKTTAAGVELLPPQLNAMKIRQDGIYTRDSRLSSARSDSDDRSFLSKERALDYAVNQAADAELGRFSLLQDLFDDGAVAEAEGRARGIDRELLGEIARQRRLVGA